MKCSILSLIIFLGFMHISFVAKAFGFGHYVESQTLKHPSVAFSGFNLYTQVSKGNSKMDINKAKRLKISGIVFCSLAGAGYLTSSVLFLKGASTYNGIDSQNRYFLNGAIGYLSSTGLLTIGLPQFLIGKRELKKHKSKTGIGGVYLY